VSYKSTRGLPWLCERMIRGVGQQCQVACTLNGEGELALVAGARPCLAAGFNLPALRDESPELVGLLVVDDVDLVHAECADLAATASPPSSAAPAAPGRS